MSSSVDKLHMKGHTDVWCKEYCDAKKLEYCTAEYICHGVVLCCVQSLDAPSVQAVTKTLISPKVVTDGGKQRYETNEKKKGWFSRGDIP